MKILVQKPDALIIPGGVIFPVHPLQHRVAAALHGEVEVGAQVIKLHGPAAELVGDGPGL